MRAYALVLALLLLIFGAIGGYVYQRVRAFSAMDFSPPPVTVAAAYADVRTWKTWVNAVGTLRAVRGIEVTSESSGEVREIRFDSGDTVEAGAVLLVLNDEVEQAERLNHIASLDLAQLLFERDSRLLEQKSIPQTQFDRSRADRDRARAQLAETEARLRTKRVRAPFSGRLGIRRVEVGDYVSPGTIIVSLQDPSELEVDFAVPADNASSLHPGLGVELEVSAFPGKLFRASLSALEARVDPGTRNLMLRARIDEPAGLLPGMFANIRLDLGVDATVVTVPETAVSFSPRGDVVHVIEPLEGGGLTANSRIVVTGETRDGRVAISEGLADRERIAVDGQHKLYRGVTVLIDESAGF